MLERRALLLTLGLALAAPLRAQVALPDLIQSAKPSVVAVGTWSPTDSPRFGYRGTGFAVGDGRLIVTNAHVLPAPETEQEGRRIAIQVWQAGRWDLREVEVAALARPHDLALLRITQGSSLPPLRLAPAEPMLREGSDIALMGFPLGNVLGQAHATHRGILAAVTPVVPLPSNSQALNERAIRQLREGGFEIYQLDVFAYPGNSGGPLFNLATGEVVGVLNMGGLIKGVREAPLLASTGISYALPIKHVLALIKQSQSP